MKMGPFVEIPCRLLAYVLPPEMSMIPHRPQSLDPNGSTRDSRLVVLRRTAQGQVKPASFISHTDLCT